MDSDSHVLKVPNNYGYQSKTCRFCSMSVEVIKPNELEIISYLENF